MGTYKGNKGNLMQHWTLCEVLRLAQRNGVTRLNYIDAHAMAPLADKPTSSDSVFPRVQASLPGQESVYENAWYALAPNPADGYPNSANFVRTVWQGDFSMLLCEVNPKTADEIDSWLTEVSGMPNCKNADLQPGDWRDMLNQGLPSLGDMGLAGDALTLASFDPYMISTRRHRFGENRGNMYPQDLERVVGALDGFQSGVLIQLSTYSSNGPTPQSEVKEMADCILGESALSIVGCASADKSMMSLIYARNVSWAGELASLSEQFNTWLRSCKR